MAARRSHGLRAHGTADAPRRPASLPQLFEVLLSFLDPPPPLNAVLAGYFGKVVCCALSRRSAQVAAALQRRPHALARLLAHVSSPSVADVLLRLAGVEEGATGGGPGGGASAAPPEPVSWLCATPFIPSLLDAVAPGSPPAAQAGAGEVLCAIARCAPCPLSEELATQHSLDRLFSSLRSIESGAAVSNGSGFGGGCRAASACLDVACQLIEPRPARGAPPSSPLMMDMGGGSGRAPGGGCGFGGALRRPGAAHPSSVATAAQPYLHAMVARMDAATRAAQAAAAAAAGGSAGGSNAGDAVSGAHVVRTSYGSVVPLGRDALSVLGFFVALFRSGASPARSALLSLDAPSSVLRVLSSHPMHSVAHSAVAAMFEVAFGGWGCGSAAPWAPPAPPPPPQHPGGLLLQQHMALHMSGLGFGLGLGGLTSNHGMGMGGGSAPPGPSPPPASPVADPPDEALLRHLVAPPCDLLGVLARLGEAGSAANPRPGHLGLVLRAANRLAELVAPPATPAQAQQQQSQAGDGGGSGINENAPPPQHASPPPPPPSELAAWLASCMASHSTWPAFSAGFVAQRNGVEAAGRWACGRPSRDPPGGFRGRGGGGGDDDGGEDEEEEDDLGLLGGSGGGGVGGDGGRGGGGGFGSLERTARAFSSGRDTSGRYDAFGDDEEEEEAAAGDGDDGERLQSGPNGGAQQTQTTQQQSLQHGKLAAAGRGGTRRRGGARGGGGGARARPGGGSGSGSGSGGSSSDEEGEEEGEEEGGGEGEEVVALSWEDHVDGGVDVATLSLVGGVAVSGGIGGGGGGSGAFRGGRGDAPRPLLRPDDDDTVLTEAPDVAASSSHAPPPSLPPPPVHHPVAAKAPHVDVAAFWRAGYDAVLTLGDV